MSRWDMYPTILHQYDRDTSLTEMFDRTLENWVAEAKKPGNVWLGAGVPKYGDSLPVRGWQMLGAGEDYAWMDRRHSFNRVPRQAIAVRVLV